MTRPSYGTLQLTTHLTFRMDTKSLQTRQLNSLFRFDSDRDDSINTSYVFAYGSVFDVGLYAAPVGVLRNFAKTSERPISVTPSDTQHVLGRVIELTEREIALLDTVAERQGAYTRFETDIVMPKTGYTVKAWVYQLFRDGEDLPCVCSALAPGAVDGSLCPLLCVV